MAWRLKKEDAASGVGEETASITYRVQGLGPLKVTLGVLQGLIWDHVGLRRFEGQGLILKTCILVTLYVSMYVYMHACMHA